MVDILLVKIPIAERAKESVRLGEVPGKVGKERKIATIFKVESVEVHPFH